MCLVVVWDLKLLQHGPGVAVSYVLRRFFPVTADLTWKLCPMALWPTCGPSTSIEGAMLNAPHGRGKFCKASKLWAFYILSGKHARNGCYGILQILGSRGQLQRSPTAHHYAHHPASWILEVVDPPWPYSTKSVAQPPWSSWGRWTQSKPPKSSRPSQAFQILLKRKAGRPAGVNWVLELNL